MQAAHKDPVFENQWEWMEKKFIFVFIIILWV